MATSADLNMNAVRSEIANLRTSYQRQPTTSVPVAGGQAVTLTQSISPTPNGLMMGAFLRVFGKINATAAATITPLGAANLLQNFSYTDTRGRNRHQCDGVTLELLGAIRQKDPIGSGDMINANYGVGYNSAWTHDVMPATIAAAATVDFSHTFYIPFAYGQNDFRGMIYGMEGGVNQQFSFTLPSKAQAFVDTAANGTGALYKSAGGACTFTELNYELVLMVKNMDIPTYQGRPIILPEVNMLYIMQKESKAALAANTDNLFPIPIGRSLCNGVLVFDNGGQLNPGTDVNFLELRFASTQSYKSLTPQMSAALTSAAIGVDLPLGCYAFLESANPINIDLVGGSADFNVNIKTLNAGATLHLHSDYFAIAQANIQTI